MIQYEKFILDNGLRVLVHEDKSTPMAVLNVLYDVGAKDESFDKTGFAHLFEHLMFGGSKNIPSYDEPLQVAGGENNAFTTNDLTNYYCQLPAENIETAFWLESDRMLSLAFSKKSLEVQRKVVCEEFKEHYINKPYGDVWHKMRELAYTTHPYRWMTIGASLKHVEDATLEDVKAFFYKHYTPTNAILVVAGNIETAQMKVLAEKWFGSIPAGEKYNRQLPVEPKQNASRFLEVKSNVPLDALYKCWHMPARMDDRYYASELISDILGGGGSSRLFQSLVKEKQLFSNIDCYHFGSTDAGLMTIEGKIVKGVNIKDAENALMEEIKKLVENGISTTELEKVKNKAESALAFEDMSLMNRASNIAMYENLGEAELINTELSKYQAVTADELLQQARIIFDDNNCNTMHYLSNN
ncbi:MAG: pitrilysin family protein [Sphingobacteriales bacterium]|nr:pitrilysin family protein [Sphingobacteriales bacterium]